MRTPAKNEMTEREEVVVRCVIPFGGAIIPISRCKESREIEELAIELMHR